MSSYEKEQNQQQKLCRVCGDVALGFNFNGLSCESCKAFFRRSAFKQKQYFCRQEKACTIDRYTRKYCKLCRLKKCFDIGMKKELINNDWQKNLEHNSQPNGDNQNEFNHWSSINHFPPYDQVHIEEIRTAMSVFCDENNLQVIGQAESILQAFNLPAYYVKQIIRFCKTFSAYKCLKQDDQISILKTAFPDVLSTRFSFIYNMESDGFPMIESEEQNGAIYVKLDLCNASKNKDVTSIFRNYLASLQMEMENDAQIRDLIMAQNLFQSHVNDLSCPEFVRYHYFVYNRLFRRYLLFKYKSVNKADQKYCSIMLILSEMEFIRKIVREVYLEMELNQIARVLGEIYDLF